MNNVFSINELLRFRYEYFGGLCWFPRGNIFRLNKDEIKMISLLTQPREYSRINNSFFSDSLTAIKTRLQAENLIVRSKKKPANLIEEEYSLINAQIAESSKRDICKPFWIHIQPFKFCNQNCIHCYCDAGQHQRKFDLSLHRWKALIDEFFDFGIFDIYVTGGENLVVNDCFLLTEYIIKKGVGTGLSTNAMCVTNDILKRIKKLNIKYIQVSLDGATPEINDYIRGTKGALEKTILGIKKLSKVVEPIMNSVINKLNIHRLEELVVLGKSLGISKFKMIPQKAVGRGSSYKQILLKKEEAELLELICEKLSNQHEVEIEYPKKGEPCGSGYSGLAVDSHGQIFPCIFGINDPNQSLGNILTNNIQTIWFDSPKLIEFRNMSSSQPCIRCEDHN